MCHAGAEQRVKSVFIFTDGISSVGVTHRSQLIAVLKAMLQTSGSLKIHTFGFGSVYDEQTLLGISEEGGGHCMYIQDAEAIPAAFATSLGGLMSVVKQNLELTFAPQVTLVHCKSASEHAQAGLLTCLSPAKSFCRYTCAK